MAAGSVNVGPGTSRFLDELERRLAYVRGRCPHVSRRVVDGSPLWFELPALCRDSPPTPACMSPASPVRLSHRFQIGASLIPPFALLWLACRNGWIAIAPGVFLAAMPAALILGMLAPSVFSGWHRAVSRIQAWIGHRLVEGLLTLVFLAVVVPVGLLFRLSGRSFLELPPADSYWRKAPAPGSLRDQF